MRQTAIFATSLLLLSMAASAADPKLLNLVVPDAKVLAGVNVLQAKATPFGNYVISQVTANNTGLQDFIKATGFDPTQDVTEILASNADLQSHAGILTAKGTFNTASIVAAAIKSGNHTVQTYAGATLITATANADSFAVAFVDGNLAIAGSVAQVQAALDRRNQANVIDPSLAAAVNQLSTTEDAWTISVASLAGLFPTGSNAGQQLAIFQNIQQSSGGVKFGANVDVTGQAVTATAKDANALGDVIKFVAQLVAMNAGKDPKAAEAATLLQNINVTTAGNTVNIGLTIPESTIEGLAKMITSPKVAAEKKAVLH